MNCRQSEISSNYKYVLGYFLQIIKPMAQAYLRPRLKTYLQRLCKVLYRHSMLRDILYEWLWDLFYLLHIASPIYNLAAKYSNIP